MRGPGLPPSPRLPRSGTCAALRASAAARWPRCPPGSPSPRSARPLVPRRSVSGSPGVPPRCLAGSPLAAPPYGGFGPGGSLAGARRGLGPALGRGAPRLVGGPGGPLGRACGCPRGLVAVSPCWAASAALVAVTLSPLNPPRPLAPAGGQGGRKAGQGPTPLRRPDRDSSGTSRASRARPPAAAVRHP